MFSVASIKQNFLKKLNYSLLLAKKKHQMGWGGGGSVLLLDPGSDYVGAWFLISQ